VTTHQLTEAINVQRNHQPSATAREGQTDRAAKISREREREISWYYGHFVAVALNRFEIALLIEQLLELKARSQ